MSNDNKDHLKARDRAQERKHSDIFSIIYILLMAFLVTSLLIPSCQHSDKQAADHIRHDDTEGK